MSLDQFHQIGKQLAEDHPDSISQMFGKPCLKVNKKAFAAFYKESMVFKLGAIEVIQMLNKYKGSENWDPSGKKRPMKDWIQIPSEYNEEWKKMAINAMNFVDSKGH
jgi:hypothetical protein